MSDPRRLEFEMTEREHADLLDACRSVPYMIIGDVHPRSPEQNANDAWRALGKKRGFQWDTVKPVSGKSDRFFTAVLAKTESGHP